MPVGDWSRLIRFVAEEDDQVYYGIPDEGLDDIGLVYHAKERPITAIVLSGSPLNSSTQSTASKRTVRRLLSPLDRREIGTIRGLGAQYGDNLKRPKVAMLFYKPTTSIAGPEDPIILPNQAQGEANDYEVELCAIIGKQGKDIPLDKALDYVLGYCVTNDVSCRTLCAQAGQWGVGKSYDSWCPIGPALIHPTQLGDPQNLSIETRVNGHMKQKGHTSKMILSVAELICTLSQGTTLEPGSIILTGSVLAVDRSTDGRPFMQHGDEVRCYVEKCGTLINHVVEEKGVKPKL